mgnify:CR=1 FL=1
MSFLRIVLALALITLPSLGADRPLTDEDIVRLVITGESADSIIALIRSSETDFDLADEMVEEMKLAGVPGRISEAMRQRHLEQTPAAEPSPEAVEIPSLPALVVHLEFKKQPVLPKTFPEEVAKQAGLREDEEGRRITGAALFVACTSATHVPDHWRGKSPLGRDFVFAPRHRMLLFEPAFQAGDGKPAPLKLALPESVRLELETGEPHDLVFGLAVEAGGRYLAIYQLRLDKFSMQEGDIHKAVRVAQKVMRTLEVTIKQVGYEPPETE